jgi:predicted component of type VI protein secretion system
MTSYRLKGTSGALINQVFSLSGRLLIGRADDCDVRIDLEGVAPHHAEVRTIGQGAVLLRDLGSATGTRLNGEPVSEARLHSGDEIQVGQCRLMLQAPGLKPERVLTEVATRPRPRHWKWLLPLALVLLAALAWQQGWLEALLALFQP